MEMLTNFGYLKIRHPNTVAEIPDSISDLRAKIEYFENLPEDAEADVRIEKTEESKA
jgi:hypothetical protein